MVLDKLASVGDGRKIRRLRDISQLVNTFEPEFEEIPTEELPAKSEEFRRRLADPLAESATRNRASIH